MNTIRLALFMICILSCSAERTEGTVAGDCSDGADNDQDGLFDCNDDSCTGSSDCSLTEDEEEDDEDLWEVILEGEDDMPAINLQPQQVADIVAWLRSIFPE